jgi:hypothetical protein
LVADCVADVKETSGRSDDQKKADLRKKKKWKKLKIFPQWRDKDRSYQAEGRARLGVWGFLAAFGHSTTQHTDRHTKRTKKTKVTSWRRWRNHHRWRQHDGFCLFVLWVFGPGTTPSSG